VVPNNSIRDIAVNIGHTSFTSSLRRTEINQHLSALAGITAPRIKISISVDYLVPRITRVFPEPGSSRTYSKYHELRTDIEVKASPRWTNDVQHDLVFGALMGATLTAMSRRYLKGGSEFLVKKCGFSGSEYKSG
jgi:hypothetical protein